MPDPAALSPASQAWHRFLDDLRASSERVDAALASMNDVERAVAHRSLMRAAILAANTALENADPAHPYFAVIDPPFFKTGGNSPDAEYYQAPLSSDYTYRIRGRRGDAAFFSFQVYARTQRGYRTDSSLIDRDMHFDADGRFELLASADPADAQAPGSWLRLTPETFGVTVRTYAHDPTTVVPPTLEIEVVDGPARFTPADEKEMARRIDAMRFQYRFFSTAGEWLATMRDTPNRFELRPMPLDPEMGFATAVQYVRGVWSLAPDQALVVEGEPPAARYWMLQLDDRFAQAFDHRHRRVSLNDAQVVLEPDGRYRIVIAHADPGLPNWLDAGGYGGGAMTFRWVDGPEASAPSTRVVPLAELRAEAERRAGHR